MSNVQLGYTQVIDPISFKSIPSGKIYIGEYGTLPNPANAGTWKQAYFVNSDGTRTAASQPIATNAAGYAVDGSGNIKTVQVDGQYSILVQSSIGVTKFSAAKVAPLASAYQIDAGGGRTQADKNAEHISVEDYGAIGDGSDETLKIQSALNAAAGGTIIFEYGKTYKYTQLSIPANTKLVTNGAVLSRISASTTHGISIASGVDIDLLSITTPGGTGGDKAIAIRGNNVTIGTLAVNGVTQGNSSSTNWAVEIESSPAGTQLSNIRICALSCTNFSTAVFAKNAKFLRIDNVDVTKYRTAFYLKDVSDSEFNVADIRQLGAASNGAPGENGLLIESSIASGSSHNIRFNGWNVKNSGEHAYRLGGQLTIRDVYFNDCISEKSGSSILNGDLSSGEWHGGCGFKVLGGNTTTTEFHENIYFNNCGVIDCNITYGSYPAGHGVNNFTPWLIVMAKNTHINNCWTKAKDQAYVSRYGVLFTAVDGLYINNCSVRDADLCALFPYEETPVVGYPGSDLPIKNLLVDGGLYEVTTATVGNGIPMYMGSNAKYAHENWTVKSAVFKGGSSALRIESISTGSYVNLNFDFTYVGTVVNDSSYATPAIAGAGASGALVNVVAPWRPAASSPAVANGSTWASPNDGEIRTRTDSVWRRDRKTYAVVIADDSFAVITPPTAGVGFIAVSGDGTATHLMGWYRSTSSPAASKYAGAATTAMVSTALTGTTGTDGNVTIGVQNNAIYIENRNGSSNTFSVTFF